MEVYSLSVVDELEAESIHILRETAADFHRPLMLCAGGVASCVLLRIAQKAFAPEHIPFAVLGIDDPKEPAPLREFRSLVLRESNLLGVRADSDSGGLDSIVKDGAFDAVIDATRRSEEPSRASQCIFSPSRALGQQDSHATRPELWNLYNTRLGKGERMQVRPLSNWTEADLRHYLARENIAKLPQGPGAESAALAVDNLLRVVIVGAEASGKSTLAAQLMGANATAATLPGGAEYRQFSSGDRRFVIIDVPGKERDMCHVAAGASHADLALLVVDARHGLVTQTRRHAFLSSLLGIPRLAIAVNKMDLVGHGERRFNQIRDEFEAFAARLGFKSLTFVPIDARRGDNVAATGAAMPWYDGQALLEHLENVYVGGDRNLVDFRLAVQSVAPDGDTRWYRGQIGSGVVKVGDEIAIVPSHRRTRVRKIALSDRQTERAFAPLSVSIALEDQIDVGRGALLAHPANMPRGVRGVDAMVVWLHDAPLRPGENYLLRQSASWVRASCATINYRIDPDSLHREDARELVLNDIGRATFTLFEERFVDAYTRNRSTGCFLLVRADDGATLGAAVLVDRETEHGRIRARKAAERLVIPHFGKVSETARSVLLRQRARTIWLTGLSGSGKSTLATELERALVDLGHACFMLDGDNVRSGLNRDLGFGPDDRTENIRRIAEVARLMNDAGLIAITAFISPYQEDRNMARNIIGEERFVEVYLDASLEACEQRDPKGLYRKARAGEIPEFTGISAPYEPPEAPSLRLDTAGRSVEQCTAQLLADVLDRIRAD
jgi:bifunctional enzyme CysN/CysC